MIKVNFDEDLNGLFLEALAQEGLTVTAQGVAESAQDYSFRIKLEFLNFKRLLIPPHPRRVFKAQDFSCPSSLHQGLEELERKIAAGEDIRAYLSKGVYRLGNNDALLNDWDIYHLHLGTTIGDDGFINRTGPLLFARFDSENAYFINVYNHGEWTDQNIIKILHDNWPKSIEHARFHDVIGLSHVPTDNDIKLGRKYKVNQSIEVGPGIVYGSIGGGFTTNGVSIQVVMAAQQYSRTIRQMEKWLHENESKIISDVIKVFPDQVMFELKLEIEDHTWYALEVHSRIRFKLGKPFRT